MRCTFSSSHEQVCTLSSTSIGCFFDVLNPFLLSVNQILRCHASARNSTVNRVYTFWRGHFDHFFWLQVWFSVYLNGEDDSRISSEQFWPRYNWYPPNLQLKSSLWVHQHFSALLNQQYRWFQIYYLSPT